MRQLLVKEPVVDSVMLSVPYFKHVKKVQNADGSDL